MSRQRERLQLGEKEAKKDDNMAATLKVVVRDQNEMKMKTNKVNEAGAAAEAAEDLRKETEAAFAKAAHAAAASLEHQNKAEAELATATKKRQEQEAAAKDADAADHRKEDNIPLQQRFRS